MGITDDYDVLTDDGWINIGKLTKDDNVATLNPLNKVLEYNKPIILYNYTNISPMFNISNDNVDVCMTINHPMYASQDNLSWALTNGSFLLNETNQYYLSANIKNKFTSIPTYTFSTAPVTLTMNKWLQFMGMFMRYGKITNLVDGLTTISYVSVNSLSWIITKINNELPVDKQFKLINSSTVDGVTTTIVKIPNYAILILNGIDNKLPSWCYKLSVSQLNILLVEGLVSPNKFPYEKYTTKNKSLADSLQAINLLANKPRIISKEVDGSYYLDIQTTITNNNQFVSTLIGYVYELSVPNFIFMARRKNKPLLI
jgi:hypothetical protein